jgi:hypothetical protein
VGAHQTFCKTYWTVKSLFALATISVFFLSACLPCKDMGRSILPVGVNTNYVTIAIFGQPKSIRLTNGEADTLLPLLLSCRECVRRTTPGVMDTPDICYIVTFQDGPKPKLFDRDVAFASTRHLLSARCPNIGTEVAIRCLLEPYMDQLDRHTVAENRNQKPVY